MLYFIAVLFGIIAFIILLLFVVLDVKYFIKACRSELCLAVVREPLELVYGAAYGTHKKRKYQAYLVDIPSKNIRGARVVYKPGFLAGGAFQVHVLDGGEVFDYPRVQRMKELLIGGGLGVLFGLALVYMECRGLI